MKKLLFLFAAMVMTFAVCQAQTTLVSVLGNSSDTVVNTAVKTLSMPTSTRGFQKVATTALTVTKISGTGAGTAQLQGSLDNINWYNVGSAYTITDVATQTTSIKTTDYGDLYTRWVVTGAGTESIRITAKFVARVQ